MGKLVFICAVRALTEVLVVIVAGTGWVVWVGPSSILGVFVNISLLEHSWSSFVRYSCRLLYLSIMVEFPHRHLRMMCLIGAIS